MKNIITLAAALVCASAAFAETYYVATVTDVVGGKSFSVVNREEAKQLDLDIRQKNALMQKVIAELKKEFAGNPAAHAGEKFYGDKLKPMTVKLSQPFQDMEKAQERAEKMQEHEDNKGVEEGKKKKKLSNSEKERAVKEAEREYAIKAFGEEVVKKVEEKIAEIAAESAAK